MNAEHRFSVVIATRNRADLLARTLEALARQQWPRDRMEIVLVDNGSTDDTRRIVEDVTGRLPMVRYRFVAKPGKSGAVNDGLACASGDLIALTDDDVQPSPMWLAELARAFDETGADFVAGRVLPIWERQPPQWLSPALHGVLAVPDNGTRRLAIAPTDKGTVVPIGANMAIRRAVFERVGGLRDDLGKLDGSLQTGEDHEFFLRMQQAGFHGVYEPEAVVHHWVPKERLSREYFRRWCYQNGRDVARLTDAYPPDVPHLLRVPRYLWRQAASDGWAALAGLVWSNPSRRFTAVARLAWCAGHLRQRWMGSDPRLRLFWVVGPRRAFHEWGDL